jgi:hypothetical protein
VSDHQAEAYSTAEIRAVVIRADGTREDLGLIAAAYPDQPVKAAWWRLVGRPLADRRIRRTNRLHPLKES